MFQALLNPMHAKLNMTISEWYSDLGMQLEITFFFTMRRIYNQVLEWPVTKKMDPLPKWFPPVQILRSIWTPRSMYFRIVLKYLDPL